jgi:hypothetical protein
MEHRETVKDVLRALDEGDFEVTDWEAHFLESVKSQRFPLSAKQLHVLETMADRYLDPLLAAELRGQQRLL